MAWQRLIDSANQARAAGQFHDALQLCDRAAQLGQAARYRAALLRGNILLDLGDAAGALSSFEAVADLDVADPEIDLARGIALFELVRFSESEGALLSAVRLDPNIAEAYHTLGRIAEFMGTGEEIEYFRMARRLAPEIFPAANKLSEIEFTALVESVLNEMPPEEASLLAYMPVIVTGLPQPNDLRAISPPLSPASLAVLIRNTEELPGVPAAAIVLYKRNFELTYADKDAMRIGMKQTILNELHAITG